MGTSTTSVTYTRISHHFKFNYLKITEVGEGGFVSTPIFRTLGHDWVIDCYPRGPYYYVSFFIRLQGESRIIFPNFTFGIMRINHTMRRFDVPITPNQDGKYGLENMVGITWLEENYITDGCFEFICSVNSVDEAKASIEAFRVITNDECQPTGTLCTNSTAVKYYRISHHFGFKTNITDLAHGEFVSSPSFKALGHEWVVDCYARGILSSGGDSSHILFFIREIQGKSVNVSPNLTFSLVRDKKFIKYSVPNNPTLGYGFGCPTIRSFIPPGFATYGDLEFICGINNKEKLDMPNETSKSCLIGNSPYDLHCQLGEMLENEDRADIIFEVDEQTFFAHKLILAARSSVFRAELFGQIADAKQQRIKISDIKADVFRAMLSYIYTDSLTDIDGTDNSKTSSTIKVKELYAAAIRYSLEGLKILLEERLCKKITNDTVAATLAFDEHYEIILNS